MEASPRTALSSLLLRMAIAFLLVISGKSISTYEAMWCLCVPVYLVHSVRRRGERKIAIEAYRQPPESRIASSSKANNLTFGPALGRDIDPFFYELIDGCSAYEGADVDQGWPGRL